MESENHMPQVEVKSSKSPEQIAEFMEHAMSLIELGSETHVTISGGRIGIRSASGNLICNLRFAEAGIALAYLIGASSVKPEYSTLT